MMSKQTPFGTISYTYDAAGDVTEIASSNAHGAAMAYQYDKLNRLATVTIPGQSPTLYGYDEVGNLAGYTYPNGVSTALQYDPLNRLTSLASQGAQGAVASYAYTLGAAGNRTGVTELSGRTVAYGYDNLYRLTSETIASDLSGMNGATGYVYDAVGNRQRMTSTLPAIAPGRWNYDANDRLTSDQNDADGNITSRAGVANAYDFENHLIQHGFMTFVYDGDGNRVAKTIGRVTTTYLVDTLNPTGYAQVLDELQSNTVTRSYTWGLQLVSESQMTTATPPANPWVTSWYGFDGHGSVRYLTNSTGAVTDTYDYDAFGNLINSTGSTANNYLFAGEQFDPDLGLYYNRARYLDVQLGRFWGMDKYEGDTGSPHSLHKFLYVANNPANLSDPSGLDSPSDFSTGMDVQEAIGEQFQAQFGVNGCVDQQITNILAGNCGAKWQVGLSFPGGMRPDLANLSTGALFEIKPIRSAALGLPQLAFYKAILGLVDPRSRNWHYGAASEFTPTTIIPLSGLRVAYVAPPVFGVIVYFVADAKDAFKLSLLEAVNIAQAVLGSTSASAAAASSGSNVISISSGTMSAAGAEAAAEGAVELDVGVDTMLDAA